MRVFFFFLVFTLLSLSSVHLPFLLRLLFFYSVLLALSLSVFLSLLLLLHSSRGVEQSSKRVR